MNDNYMYMYNNISVVMDVMGKIHTSTVVSTHIGLSIPSAHTRPPPPPPPPPKFCLKYPIKVQNLSSASTLYLGRGENGLHTL